MTDPGPEHEFLAERTHSSAADRTVRHGPACSPDILHRFTIDARASASTSSSPPAERGEFAAYPHGEMSRWS